MLNKRFYIFVACCVKSDIKPTVYLTQLIASLPILFNIRLYSSPSVVQGSSVGGIVYYSEVVLVILLNSTVYIYSMRGCAKEGLT